MIRTVEFHVEGMTCSGCASSIERALRMHREVKEAHVDLKHHTVKVEAEEGFTADAIRECVASLGFEVPIHSEAAFAGS